MIYDIENVRNAEIIRINDLCDPVANEFLPVDVVQTNIRILEEIDKNDQDTMNLDEKALVNILLINLLNRKAKSFGS